jgi:vacuolar-type H+-ATPase subunit E/Vma4
MSMEKVIERIRVDSSRQASEIISSSKKEAEELLSASLTEAAAEQSRIRESGRKETASRVAQILAQGRLEAREIMRSAREELIARCFAKAEEELGRLPDTPIYTTILERLMLEGIDLIGGDEVWLMVNQRDQQLIEEIAGKFTRQYPAIRISDQCLRSGAGIVIRSSSGKISVDNTFNARLLRMKKDLVFDTAEILFGQRRSSE